jgi:hypothetical protein
MGTVDHWEPPDDVAGTVDLKAGAMVVLMPSDGPTLLVGRSSDGNWRCVADLVLTEADQFVISRVDVRPWWNKVQRLGTDVLRRLPLDAWLARAHLWITEPIRKWVKEEGEPSRPLGAKDLRRLRASAKRIAASQTPRPGPSGYGNAFYRHIALTYLEVQKEIGRGIQGRIAELENQSGNHQGPVSAANARDWTRKATVLGYLSPGTRGRAGRAPGPNLINDKED